MSDIEQAKKEIKAAISDVLEELMQTPNLHEDWKGQFKDVFREVNADRKEELE